jgi:hypothetical protein
MRHGYACRHAHRHAFGRRPNAWVRRTKLESGRRDTYPQAAIDNHAARALLDRHVATLRDATLVSGGNDETDGNVQFVRRRDGWSVDGHLVEIHPEIGETADREASAEPGCQGLAAERPHLLAGRTRTVSLPIAARARRRLPVRLRRHQLGIASCPMT